MIDQEWTIADENGNSLVTFQSFISCEVADEGEVLKMPTEQGGFAAYNKIAEPIRIRVNLALQGDDADMQAALVVLKALKEGVQTFSLVTPTMEYRSLTLESFNYARKREDGLKVCYVELSLVEVREVEAQYTETKRRPLSRKKVKNADCASKQAQGNVTAQQGGTSARSSVLKNGWNLITGGTEGR